MVRFLGIVGLGGGFLIISPKLRHELVGALGAQREYVVAHAPLSYVAIGAALLGAALIYMYRCAKPR
jgi:hypothetical protein